jgi:Tol biopolymer transport system component
VAATTVDEPLASDLLRSAEVANVDDLLAGVAQPQNITNSSDVIDNDPNWSPDGLKVAFTRHSAPAPDPRNPSEAEIYVINSDATEPTQLTDNDYEERAPQWSPDGSRIVFMARVGTQPGPQPGFNFEICVMNADGTNFVQLTDNAVFDGGPNFSPDGQKIVFIRSLGPGLGQELFTINADGTNEIQLTSTPGFNTLARWGLLRILRVR